MVLECKWQKTIVKVFVYRVYINKNLSFSTFLSVGLWGGGVFLQPGEWPANSALHYQQLQQVNETSSASRHFRQTQLVDPHISGKS